MGGKQKLRYVSFKEMPGMPTFGVFIGAWIVSIFVILVTAFGEFRVFYFPMTPPLSVTRFNATLWRVEAFAHCLSVVSASPLGKLCRGFVNALHGKSMADFVATVCAYEGMLFSLGDMGCVAANMLRTGSGIFASGLLLGAMMHILAAMGILVWWFSFRRMKLRMGIIVAFMCGSIVQLGALVAYLILTGANLVPSGVMGVNFGLQSSVSEIQPTDLSYGFFAVCFGGVCGFVLCPAAMGGLRKDCCVDFEEDVEEEECRNLIQRFHGIV